MVVFNNEHQPMLFEGDMSTAFNKKNDTDPINICNETGLITFSIRRLDMAMHRGTFYCTTFPHPNVKGGQPMKSKEEIIKIVPGKLNYLQQNFVMFV